MIELELKKWKRIVLEKDKFLISFLNIIKFFIEDDIELINIFQLWLFGRQYRGHIFTSYKSQNSLIKLNF
ncbi:unnamed protein product [Blepharisma stoltei]|uniref:Uncharacterized protein n=1 Tax=Blepharisma stoltei TaxID=1481888 RepID=A0AAU9JLX5_9CILI|nr:unnamed protein product [Blepharisma stoltei]